MTELPDWVVDELPARARGGVPLLLVVKLFRHGSPVVDPGTGGRRSYWCGQLPRLTGASKRALDAAVEELVSLGVIRVHEPLRAGSARGYSVGFDAPAWGVVPGPCGPVRGVVPVVAGGAEIATLNREGGAENATHQIQGGAKNADPSESRAHANGGGGDLDPLTEPVGVGIHHHHSSGESREQILRTLRELGVDSPAALLASHGPSRVLGALGELSGEMRRGEVRNPAGWLVSALVDRERVFEEPSGPIEVPRPVDAFEAQKAKYLGWWRDRGLLSKTSSAAEAGVARRVEQVAEAVVVQPTSSANLAAARKRQRQARKAGRR